MSKNTLALAKSTYRTMDSEEVDYKTYRTIDEMKSTLKKTSQSKSKVRINLVLDERIIKNLQKWKRLQMKQFLKNYNTGGFNIPLVSINNNYINNK
jgi:hypothetical protein